MEDVLRVLVETLVTTSLNEGLPAFPTPRFTLPSSLAPYGVPAGMEMGVVSPTLVGRPQHHHLEGAFRLR